MKKKILLAYSGGLVNSVAIHWLRHHKAMRVVTVSVELGQGYDLEEMAEHALMLGADGAHIADLRDEFLRDYAFPTLRAGARYEGRYLLSTALSRPLIAKEMIRLAREDGAAYIGHGGYARSNDQFRFEAAVAALAPELEVFAPWLEWKFRSIPEIRDYARQHNIQIPPTVGREPSVYTRDRNIWGCRTSGGPLEGLDDAPPDEAFVLTRSVRDAEAEPADLLIGFDAGVPTSLDGEVIPRVELIEELNRIGGAHGVGRIDHLENRLVGTKIRELYEAPAATICYAGREALERLVLGARALHKKARFSDEFAELVYDGHWFSDLREALTAFFNRLQHHVAGEVRIRIHKGNVDVIAATSPYSLYEQEMSAYGRSEPEDIKAVTGWMRMVRSVDRLESRVRQRVAKSRPGTGRYRKPKGLS